MAEVQKQPGPKDPKNVTAPPTAPAAVPVIPKSSVSLLDRIKAQVASMKPEDVQAELTKLRTQREKQKKYRGKYSELSPEAKAKRKEYNKKRMADPAVKAKQLEYRKSPKTKEKQKAYRKVRAERQKLLLQKAADMGLTV